MWALATFRHQRQHALFYHNVCIAQRNRDEVSLFYPFNYLIGMKFLRLIKNLQESLKYCYCQL